MKKPFVAAGFVLLSFMLPAQASAAKFNQLYIFGDSLSDTGNVFNATTGQFPPSPPSPQASVYFQGGFSNGPLWVEYLGQKLGLTPTLFTELQSRPPIQGVNFAFGGATSGIQNAFAPFPTGVLAQVEAYKQNLPANPQALYTVWGGGNDYLFGNLPLNDPTITETVTDNLALAISSLAQAGAKNFLVPNLPDLGASPFLNNNPQLAGFFNNLTKSHNEKLASKLTELSQNLGINIIDLNVNDLFRKITPNPQAFNLTNTIDACLIGDFDSIRAGNFALCNDPDNYLFFDAVHPTTKGHRLIANAAIAAIQAESVPEPTAALGILAFGALSTTSILKRRQKELTLSANMQNKTL
jgi:phospholipase/lecithinase/hemolysin